MLSSVCNYTRLACTLCSSTHSMRVFSLGSSCFALCAMRVLCLGRVCAASRSRSTRVVTLSVGVRVDRLHPYFGHRILLVSNLFNLLIVKLNSVGVAVRAAHRRRLRGEKRSGAKASALLGCEQRPPGVAQRLCTQPGHFTAAPAPARTTATTTTSPRGCCASHVLRVRE